MRKGGKKAIVAMGHKIIIAVYHVLAKKEVYKAPDSSNAKHDAKKKQKEVQRSITKLSQLGFTVRITLVS